MTHPTQEDDVKALKDALDEHVNFGDKCVSYDADEWLAAASPWRLTRLLARLEQAERDAARYRWLRSKGGKSWTHIERNGLATDALYDCAVDAAIASEAGK